MDRIVIRTHGGLGNQIFQVFFAMVRHQGTIILYHDDRYSHGFQLASCFQSYFPEGVNFFESLMCRSRIVKLVEKFSSAVPEVRLGDRFFLDGYFQKFDFYSQVSGHRLSAGLHQLRDIFGITGEPDRNMLSHIRLADFFKTDGERSEAAKKRLFSLDDNTDFISTNDQLIMNDKACQKIIAAKNLVHIETAGFSSEDTIRLMSNYRVIESNNSTLAFWAAVLSNSELIVDDVNLGKVFLLLKNSRNYK